MKIKEGKHLCNARVDVDYSSGKPKIKFKYPSKNPKKDSTKQGGLWFMLILIWLLIGLVPYIYMAYPSLNESPYPNQCGNLSLDNINYNWTTEYKGDLNGTIEDRIDTVYGFNLTCDNNTHIFKWNTIRERYSPNGFYESHETKEYIKQLIPIIWLLISLILSIILDRMITKFLVKKKWYQKWLPKANADGIIFKKRNKKYYKYKPKDMTGNVIVIPRFNNVELDYITKGDFGSKLKSIIIREYKQRKIDIKTKKKSKEKVEHFKWYAVFEFTEKPKKGFLEVIYQ